VLAEAAPAATALVAGAERIGALRGFPGVPGYLRRATGPGWALGRVSRILGLGRGRHRRCMIGMT
jgi:hypothetical protein